MHENSHHRGGLRGDIDGSDRQVDIRSLVPVFRFSLRNFIPPTRLCGTLQTALQHVRLPLGLHSRLDVAGFRRRRNPGPASFN